MAWTLEGISLIKPDTSVQRSKAAVAKREKRASERKKAATLEMLDKYKDKRFFFFVHFAKVDHMGHQFGENSKEYNDAVKSGDLWLGKIVDKLKALKLYDRTRT